MGKSLCVRMGCAGGEQGIHKQVAVDGRLKRAMHDCSGGRNGVAVIEKVIRTKPAKKEIAVIYTVVIFGKIIKGLAEEGAAICNSVSNGFALVIIGASENVELALFYIKVAAEVKFSALVYACTYAAIITGFAVLLE